MLLIGELSVGTGAGEGAGVYSERSSGVTESCGFGTDFRGVAATL